MSRHLYAVPDPGPDEVPSAGEWSNPTPTDHPVRGFSDGPADGGEVAGEWPGSTSTANAPAIVADAEQLDDAPRGLMERLGLDVVSMPTDLGQYCDVRQLGVYKPYMIAAGRHLGAFLFRALRMLVLGGGLILVHVLQVLFRGAGLLLGLLWGWLTGSIGTWPKGALPLRFAISAVVAYVVVLWSATNPAVAWWLAVPVLLVASLAGQGHLPAPSPATDANTAKSKAKAKTGKPKTDAAKPKGKTSKTETETETAEPAEPATTSLMDRLKALRKSAGDSPAEVTEATTEDDAEEEWEDPEEDWDDTEEEAPETAWEEVPETPNDNPPEAAPDTSREALTEALHALAPGGRGVLLTALCKHLELPDTKHVKAALEEAGIRWRKGVRTPIGSGPGVHPEDVPPLPSLQGYPPGSGVCAGQQPTPTPTPTPTAPEEGLRVDRMNDRGFTLSPPDAGRYFSV